MHCPWQLLIPGKGLTPWDVVKGEMDEEFIRFASRNGLERVAAFKQLQGYSNQLRVMSAYSNPSLTLYSFRLPQTFTLRPVNAMEGRKTLRLGDQDISYIVDTRTKVRIAILPTQPIKVRLLTLQLDQGSIGSAGAAFCMFHMHLMVMAVFDKIHRLIRDIKGAENDCCKKMFTKAKLWSAYLFSLNKRPFGGGGNATLKQRWMGIFEQTEDIHSKVFVKYLPKIAKAWNMPYSTTEEKQAIFNKVLLLESFSKHLSHPKLANWFAWNKSAHEQLPEFFAAKMVFESQVEKECDLPDPDECGSFEIGRGVDPRKELQAILKNGGGLRLGYRLMKQDLYQHVCIMSIAEKACWDYYTKEVLFIQSPADNLRRTWELSRAWAAEPHIWATLEETLLTPANLDFMQIPKGPSESATKALHLSWTLASKRMWTMGKYTAPPYCYAEVLRPGDELASHTCCDEMKTHHQNILSLETSMHIVTDSKELWEACLFLNMSPVRLVLEYFRQDRYRKSSPQGRHLLMGLVALLADNKIAEDIHAKLRLAAKHHANSKLAAQTIQDEINHSDVIEARHITHNVAVSKDFSLP